MFIIAISIFVIHDAYTDIKLDFTEDDFNPNQNISRDTLASTENALTGWNYNFIFLFLGLIGLSFS